MRKGIGLFTTLMVCMAMALCVSCKPDDNEPGGGTQTVATVTTNEVTEITQTTAVCGGEVMSENGWAVTERGVCWGTEPNPTPSDNCTVDGDGIGKFTSVITGLIPGTKYYVRAYAKNAAGTGFGAERSFTTGDHEYVDLGLPSGLLWATCNVGADKPEDYGDYYQWGGVTPVTSTSINVGWDGCPGNGGSGGGYNATAFNTWKAANLTNDVLKPEVDAATANWGGGWRMPTTGDWKELYDNTTSVWTNSYNGTGVKGRVFTSKNNDKTLFLPAAAMARMCAMRVPTATTGRVRSSRPSPTTRTACASGRAMSIRSATTTGATGLQCARCASPGSRSLQNLTLPAPQRGGAITQSQGHTSFFGVRPFFLTITKT